MLGGPYPITCHDTHYLIYIIYIYVRVYRERNPNRGRGRGGFEDMEFPGVLAKFHVEILGVNWKGSAISRGDQEL